MNENKYFEVEIEVKKIIVQVRNKKEIESGVWHEIIQNGEHIFKIKNAIEVTEEYANSH